MRYAKVFPNAEKIFFAYPIEVFILGEKILSEKT